MSNEENYWDCVCDKDACWKNYCKFPTDQTWAIYTEACANEQAAEQMLALDGLRLCGCGQVVKIEESCEYGCVAEIARQ